MTQGFPSKVMVTGASGLLGHRLLASLEQRSLQQGVPHTSIGTYFQHHFRSHGSSLVYLDLKDEDATKALMDGLSPELLVHTAAMVNVDECERNRSQAEIINAKATGWLASAAADIGCPMIYISSDLVFSHSDTPWKPDDHPTPMSHYGLTKYLGEQVTLDASQDNTVVRTSLLLGPKGLPHQSNWMSWLIDISKTGRPVNLFSDQYRNATHLDDAVASISSIATGKAHGTFHVACRDCRSRSQMGYAIAKTLGLDTSGFKETLMAEDETLMANRPKKLCLDVSQTESGLGIRMPAFKEVLYRIAQERDLFSKR